ncbi:hypothetical protein FM102_11340 [Corynebacterium glutamicum]|nr:hypothetical protein FM102_11340 [Corynebacterium glutamicum]
MCSFLTSTLEDSVFESMNFLFDLLGIRQKTATVIDGRNLT